MTSKLHIIIVMYYPDNTWEVEMRNVIISNEPLSIGDRFVYMNKIILPELFGEIFFSKEYFSSNSVERKKLIAIL